MDYCVAPDAVMAKQVALTPSRLIEFILETLTLSLFARPASMLLGTGLLMEDRTMSEYIKLEDIKNMIGDDRLQSDILVAIEKGRIPTYEDKE